MTPRLLTPVNDRAELPSTELGKAVGGEGLWCEIGVLLDMLHLRNTEAVGQRRENFWDSAVLSYGRNTFLVHVLSLSS